MLGSSTEEQLQILRSHMLQADKSLSNKPEGCLQICSNRTTRQYFYRPTPETKKGIYLRKEKRQLAYDLAQKSYDQKFLAAAADLEKKLEFFLREGGKMENHDFYQALAAPYLKLSPARRELVSPYVLPDDMYVREWLSVPYEGLHFGSEQDMFVTERGERVRSKSEKIIADKLFLKRIPYRYEFPLYIKALGTVYPDFIILDVWNRQIIIFEHFGMMQDPDYCVRTMNKIEAYEQAGYYIGESFLFPMESSDHIINMGFFEDMIDRRLPHAGGIVFA